MLLRQIFLIIILCTFNTAKAASINTVTPLHQGTLSCTLKNQQNTTSTTCELSSAAIILATDQKTKFILSTNDKEEKMYVFKFEDIVTTKKEFSRKIAPIYVQDIPIDKVESISVYKDIGFAVGSYIKDKPNLSKIISFNIDPKGKIINIKDVAGSELRNKIQAAYEKAGRTKPEYINIEASSLLIPNKNNTNLMQMLLGIREQGQDSKKCDYAVTIFGVDLNKANGSFKLADNINLIRDDSAKMPNHGISDLSFNWKKNILLMLTSIEDKEKNILSSQLWFLDYNNDLSNGQFQSIDDVNNIIKGHKSEGVAWIDDEGTIIIIADDDRVDTNLANGTKRTADESPFWLLKLGITK